VTLLDRVAARLARNDMLQAGVMLFVALGFALVIQWPSGATTANESWFTVAPVRLALLSIGAMAWGAGLGARPPAARSRRDTDGIDLPILGSPAWRAECAATLGALLALVVVTAPFEIATHAASYPDASLAWSLGVPLLAVIGYFGGGLLVGRVAEALRMSTMLALIVPTVFAATVWLDVSLDRTVLNPWSAALAVSVPFAACLGALAVVTLFALVPSRRTVTPGSGGGDGGTEVDAGRGAAA